MSKLEIARRAALGTVLVTLAACASTVGRKFDTAYVAEIERGKTTKADIRAHLGEPERTLGNGDPNAETWLYQYMNAGSYMACARQQFTLKTPASSSQSLTIRFSGNTAADYRFQSTVQN